MDPTLRTRVVEELAIENVVVDGAFNVGIYVGAARTEMGDSTFDRAYN